MLVGLLIVFVIAVLLIRTPYVQTRIVNFAEGEFEAITGRQLSIDHLYISFKGQLLIDRIFLEDFKGDTLLYGNHISVGFNIPALFRNKIEAEHILLDGVVFNMLRNDTDSTFNFDYIIQSFGDESKTPDTVEIENPSSSLSILADQLTLKDFKYIFMDQVSGFDVSANGKLITISEAQVNLDSLAIQASRLTIDNVEGSFVQKYYPPDDTATEAEYSGEPSPLTIDLKDLSIKQTKITYQSKPDKYLARAILGNLNFKNNHFSLDKQSIRCDRLQFDDSNLSFEMDGLPASDSVKKDATDVYKNSNNKPWLIAINTANFAEDTFSFDDWSFADSIPHAFNPYHMKMGSFSGEMDGFKMRSDGFISVATEQLSFLLDDYFQLKSFKGGMDLDPDKITIKNLSLSTGHSFVSNLNSNLFLSDFDIVPDLDLKLSNCKIGLNDIIYFTPDLDTLRKYIRDDFSLNLTTQLNIRQAYVDVRSLNLATNDNGFNTSLAGRIDNFAEPKELRFNGVKWLANLNKTALYKNINPKSLKIMVPDSLQFKSYLTGNLSAGELKSEIISSIGDMQLSVLSAQVNNDSTSFSIKIDSDTMDLELWLGEDFNKFLIAARLSSTHSHENFSNFHVNSLFDEILYNNYLYEGLKLDGAFTKEAFDGLVNYSDDYLKIDFDGKIAFDSTSANYDFVLDAPLIDLYELNFYASPLRIRGKVESDLSLNNELEPDGKVSLSNISVLNYDEPYQIESINISANTSKGFYEYKIESDLINGIYKGTMGIPDALNILTRGFGIRDSLLSAPPGDFELECTFPGIRPLAQVTLPELKELEIKSLRASHDGSVGQTSFYLNAPLIEYSSLKVDATTVSYILNQDSGNLELTNKSILWKDIKIEKLRTGVVHNKNHNHFFLKIPETQKQNQTAVDVNLYIEKNKRILSLDGPLTVNGYKWYIDDDNSLVINDRITTHNFQLYRNDQAIALKRDQIDSVLILDLKNIALAQFFPENQDNKLIGGMLSGNIGFSELTSENLISGTLSIDGLTSSGILLGDLSINLESSLEKYQLAIKLNHKDKDIIALSGEYLPHRNGAISLNGDIKGFRLNTIKPLVVSTFSELTGQVNANIEATGSLKEPVVNGSINLNNVQLVPRLTNSPLHLNSETITIDNNSFTFNKYRLYDKNENFTQFDGKIFLNEENIIALDVHVSMNKFLIFDRQEVSDFPYKGSLVVGSDLDIGGTSALPVVDGNIELLKGSEFFYMVPDEGISDALNQDIVQFYNPVITSDPFFDPIDSIKSVKAQSSARQIEGLDLNTNISISEDASFTIVLDQLQGDQLKLKGEGDLSFQMEPAGAMFLTGNYIVSEGHYALNFSDLVKKKFQIAAGSSVRWTGDPYDAILDIKAIYNLKAFPPFAASDQKLPFDMNILLSDHLLSPEIDFEIELEKNAASQFGQVAGILEQINNTESQLNQQVFSLLLFNRFTESSQTTGISNTLDNSISGFLTGQINRLASSIDGLALQVDFQTYQTESERNTELELGLTKEFLEGRLTVDISGSMDVEGDFEQSSVNNLSEDIVLEYKLNEAGNYRLQVFRKSEYDGYIQGETKENGVGFVVIWNYDRFRELFL